MEEFVHAFFNVATFVAVTGSLTLMVWLITFLGNLGYTLAADALHIPCSEVELDGSAAARETTSRAPESAHRDTRAGSLPPLPERRARLSLNTFRGQLVEAEGRSRFVHNHRISHRLRSQRAS